MARKPIKLKTLEQYLQHVEMFDHPKVQLEQYATSPHLAACMLLAVYGNGDLEGRLVADLGCGSGTLTFGAARLGAALAVGFEIDQDALDMFAVNREELEVEACDSVQCEVTSGLSERWFDVFDTVVMNPPFGTRLRGVDLQFVCSALHLATTAVYSLHKTSTRRHILSTANSWGVRAEAIAQLRFDLPNTYKFHTKGSVDIEVDLIRFWFDKPKSECEFMKSV